MNTPIRDFVENYSKAEKIRLHMPGHKGKSFVGAEKYDITEIEGADVLYSADGIIRESENNASLLFSSYRTFYSVEGSSLCIKAMLALIAVSRSDKSRRTRIIAARNVHKAFIYGCAISDIDVEWLYGEGEGHICSCNITAKALEEKLKEVNGSADAVYITSPDYLGQLADVEALSAICDKCNLPLLVDNAHGAYLAFFDKSRHPIHQGAYMCCDSAHKTLPVLTGGAYLHFSEKAAALVPSAGSIMSVMGSTSPSYLILQSLDMCNGYLSDGYREKLCDTVKRIDKLKAELTSIGFSVLPGEKLKLVIDLRNSKITSSEFLSHIRQNGIEPEFCDNDFAVFMFTNENDEKDYIGLYRCLSAISRERVRIVASCAQTTDFPEKAMSIRDAVFSKKETVTVENSVGRICADPSVSCPPAVPLAVSGERITQTVAEKMLYYGIKTVGVVIE